MPPCTATRYLMTSATDGVRALQRAFAILEAFSDAPCLSLAELTRRCGLPKSSTLRLARTLESAGYLGRVTDGSWRLGAAAARLGCNYQRAFDPAGLVPPLLRHLAVTTGRTASFFVNEGQSRVLLMRAEHVDESRAIKLGEQRPLDRGAAGKVILAFSGACGAPFEYIRKQGFDATIAEAHVSMASVAAPVFGRQWSVLGSVAVSAEAKHVTMAELHAAARAVKEIARRLSSELARQGITTIGLGRAWHPG